jgi:hypothetical protein
MIDNDENQRPLSTEGVPTDAIISHYESKINRSIATKILKSSTTNETPVFTKEELDYLSKKAIDESPLTEVKVITTTPLITLKKGNTEIKVKNAAALVQKMEEKYPTPSSIKYTDAERKIDNHTLEDDELAQRIYPERDKVEKVHTVNKNAYEIRTDILAMAIDWLQYQTDMAVRERGNETHIPLSAPSNDEVLATAKQFYSFVENSR